MRVAWLPIADHYRPVVLTSLPTRLLYTKRCGYLKGDSTFDLSQSEMKNLKREMENLVLQTLPRYSSSLISGSAEVILQTHNIIFTQVSAALYFNKNKYLFTGILHAMRGANSDVNSLSCSYHSLTII